MKKTEYKKQMENSKNDGNSSAATNYYNMIQENNSAMNNISNNNVTMGNEDKLQSGAIQSLKDFVPKKFVSNTSNIIKIIEDYIDLN